MAKKNFTELLKSYQKRVEIWLKNIKGTQYNKEQNTTIKFIIPLFEILGWDPHSRDMEFEYLIYDKNKSARHADIALYVRNSEHPKIIVEIKPIQHKTLGSSQIFKYIRDAKVTYGIMTNGRELKIYDRRFCRADSGRAKKLLGLKAEDFIRYKNVLLMLSKRMVEKGEFDKLAKAYCSTTYVPWVKLQRIKLQKPRLSKFDKYELPLKYASEFLSKSFQIKRRGGL